jgi:TRAP-type transport system periplasmic protein
MQKTITTLTLAGILSLAANTASGQNMIYGSWPPASDYLNEVTLPEAFEAIARDTNGEVTWELIAGGQLADGRGTFSAVSDGLMEAGLAIPVYVPDAMPSLTLLYSVVVAGDDPVATAGAALETLFLECDGCLDEARNLNALPLGGFASASYRLMCTSPVASLSDMSGLRIRATGGYGEIATLAGANPMSVTLTDAVSLLQRGGLDCLMAAREWLQTYGYGDFAKYVTDVPLGTTGPAIGFYMNRDAFAGMSTENKSVHLRQAAYVSAKHTIGNYLLKDQESFDQQVAQNGVQLVEADDELRDLVLSFPERDRERLINAGNTLGVSDPAAILDAYARNVEKWRQLSEEIGDDVDAFAEVLWQEVFSKVDPDAL